jgi:hypothetical protein
LIDNITEWTDLRISTLLRVAERRDQWKTLCGAASALTPLRPADRVTGIWWWWHWLLVVVVPSLCYRSTWQRLLLLPFCLSIAVETVFHFDYFYIFINQLHLSSSKLELSCSKCIWKIEEYYFVQNSILFSYICAHAFCNDNIVRQRPYTLIIPSFFVIENSLFHFYENSNF